MSKNVKEHISTYLTVKPRKEEAVFGPCVEIDCVSGMIYYKHVFVVENQSISWRIFRCQGLLWSKWSGTSVCTNHWTRLWHWHSYGFGLSTTDLQRCQKCTLIIQYMLYSLSQDRICNMVFPILAFIPWSCDRFLKQSTSFPSPDSESSGVWFPLAFCIVCKSRPDNLTTDRKDILRSIKKS